MQYKRERAIISNISSNNEATMSQVASNSIAMVILTLQDTYLGKNPSEELVKQLQVDAMKTLESVSPCVDFMTYIQNTMQEKINRVDQVTVLVLDKDNEYKQQTILLPLKIVLPLLIKASADDGKFVQNYEGTAQEQLQQAQADQPNRFLSLVNCLIDAERGGICHQGLRNALVLLLNKTYEGVDIIEDPSALVVYALKEKIWERFYQYRSGLQTLEDQINFGKAVYTWITTYDASNLCQLIDQDNRIKTEIVQYFKDNGSDVATITLKYDTNTVSLEEFIDLTKTALDFLPDVKKESLLCMVKQLLEEVPERNNTSKKDQALIVIQSWIERFFLLNMTQENKIISGFYSIYQGSKCLSSYQSLLLITNPAVYVELEYLSQSFENYYINIANCKDDCLPCAPEESAIQIIRLQKLVEEVKQDAMVDDIVNFFSSWFCAIKEGSDRSKNLYSLLLSLPFQGKIKWSDEAIEALYQKYCLTENDQAILSMNQYQINRIFLHAFLVDVKQWSECFKTLFSSVLSFVKKLSTDDFLTYSLSLSSYPTQLIDSLVYLQALWSHHNKGELKPIRTYLNGDLLLPHHVQGIDDWIQLSTYLNAENHKKLYEKLSWRLKPWLINGLKEINSIGNFERFVSLLPDSYREDFFSVININSVFEQIVRGLDYRDDRSFVSLLFFRVLSVENIKKLIKDNPEVISIYYFACFSLSIFKNIQHESFIEKIDSFKDNINILSDEKKQLFWNELCPFFRNEMINNACCIEIFFRDNIFNDSCYLEFSKGTKERLFAAYMMQANIDNEEYFNAFQALNSIGKAVLIDSIANLVNENFSSNILNGLDLKIIYDDFLQASIMISHNKNELKPIYDNSDDNSDENEQIQLHIGYNTIALLTLFYADLLSKKLLDKLKNHWDFFVVCAIKFGQITFQNNSQYLSCINHSGVISLIIDSVVTHSDSGFISIKRIEQYDAISEAMDTLSDISVKINMFINHQKLNKFGADLFESVAHSIMRYDYHIIEDNGLCRKKINTLDYDALYNVITIISESKGTKQLSPIALGVVLLFKKGLLTADNAVILGKNWPYFSIAIEISNIIDTKGRLFQDYQFLIDSLFLADSKTQSIPDFSIQKEKKYLELMKWIHGLGLNIASFHTPQFYHRFQCNNFEDLSTEIYTGVIQLLDCNWAEHFGFKLGYLLSELPSDLHPLLFQTIGTDNLDKILQTFEFNQLIDILKSCSLKTSEDLCFWLKKSVVFQKAYYSNSDFLAEGEIFYSKQSLTELVNRCSVETQAIIWQTISDCENVSMVKFFQNNPTFLTGNSPTLLLKPFMMDAKLDTINHWRQYQQLDCVQKNRLEELLFDFIKQNPGAFDAIDTAYLQGIYHHFFEMVSSFDHNYRAGVMESIKKNRSSILKSQSRENKDNLASVETCSSLMFFTCQDNRRSPKLQPIELTLLEKLYVYLILISGSIAQIVTLGMLGNGWVDWAHDQLTPQVSVLI